MRTKSHKTHKVTNTQIFTHIHMHTHTHAHMYEHTLAHTHTHTNTHTHRVFVSPPDLFWVFDTLEGTELFHWLLNGSSCKMHNTVLLYICYCLLFTMYNTGQTILSPFCWFNLSLFFWLCWNLENRSVLVQFKMVFTWSGKPVCASPNLLEVSAVLPINQFQCRSDPFSFFQGMSSSSSSVWISLL